MGAECYCGKLNGRLRHLRRRLRAALLYLGADSALDDGVVTAADYPSEDDVRSGVDYDSGALTGNLTLPNVNDVSNGIDYGANGTEFDGDLVLPTAAQVENGVGFGADGTEFTGTLDPGSGGGSTGGGITDIT